MTLPFPRRILLLSCLLLLLSACSLRQDIAQPGPAGPTDTSLSSGDRAAQIWRRYAAQSAAADSMTGPFRISANLRYTSASGESTRVSSLLWGNGKHDSPHPLRLDLLAGVGMVVAKIREDAGIFTAYSPDEKTVYTHAGGDQTLEAFGVPIPLTLGDLTLLLTGQSGRLFLPSPGKNDATPLPERALTQNGARYTLTTARLPGILELSATGVPLSWTERTQNGQNGWTISIETQEAAPHLPRKLRISHPGGATAIIVVKDISRVSPPYTTAQMELVLPPGTVTRALEE